MGLTWPVAKQQNDLNIFIVAARWLAAIQAHMIMNIHISITKSITCLDIHVPYYRQCRSDKHAVVFTGSEVVLI